MYDKEYFNYIIVSGGLGKEGFSEAIVKKQYLIEKGIPSDNIILYEIGNNSYMTAVNTKVIMEHLNFNTVGWFG